MEVKEYRQNNISILECTIAVNQWKTIPARVRKTEKLCKVYILNFSKQCSPWSMRL